LSPEIRQSRPLKPSKILVTGAAGLLAPFIHAAGAGLHWIEMTARNDASFPCDLTDRPAVATMTASIAPDMVIHCAAMTNVDGCETDPAAADRGNRLTCENLAVTLPATCHLINISTDQVYPDLSGPHGEGTEDPVNAYGRSKLAGEQAILRHPGGLVLRTSFFGPSKTPGRQSLSDFVTESLSANKNITLFEDILFSPLHTDTLVELIFELVDRRTTGTFNLACRDGLSKAEFALRIARHLGLQTETATIGISVSQPGRAVRAADLRMNPARLEQVLGRQMPTLQQEIERL
jgi:dTDP-4-dehydrorhamnose reductase